MPALRRSTTLAFLALAALTAPAHAIVVRDDIPDAAYLARESDYPAVFYLYRSSQGFPDCMATLIAPDWAVTAKHCTDVKKLTDAVAASGKGYNLTIAGRAATVDRVVRYPGTGDKALDIALLHFAKSVSHVAPVPLYRGAEEAGQVIVMPGGGQTGNGKTGLAKEDGRFRVAENRVDKAENGRLWWRFDAPGPASPALTLEGISGPGDSGGPALLQTPSGWTIAGVSSAQDTKGGPEGLYGVDEVFVRISEVAVWVESVTRADFRQNGHQPSSSSFDGGGGATQRDTPVSHRKPGAHWLLAVHWRWHVPSVPAQA